MTDTINAPIKPLAVSIDEAGRLTDLSRAGIYNAIARGELEAFKDGSRTKIIFASIERRMASLPRVTMKEYVPRAGRERL